MNNECKVSIIVPVYNVSEYIEASVKSICSQDFDDYMLILVNDGTKDDSVEKAEKVLKECNFTNYTVINKENGGLPAARNTGLRAAKSKYVAFVDSDDIIDKHFVSRLYELCEKEEAVAAFTDYEVTRLGCREGVNDSDEGFEVLSRDELVFYNMTRKVKIHLCATLLNREFLINNNLWFNEKLRYGEEVDYTWRMYPLINKMIHSKTYMYKYLVRENSLMTNQNSDRVVYLFKNMHHVIKKWFAESKADAEKFRWAEFKIYFEKLHAFAKQSDYETFKALAVRTNYKKRMKKLFDFPDLKIKVLSMICFVSPRAFWSIFRYLEK